MSVQELGQLYARGGVPDSLEVLDGSPQGRMLAIAGTGRGMLAKGLRRVAASSGFPWGGKSFSSSSPREGRGINRVRLGGRHLLFPFQTEFCASRIDDRPTIRLDYDLDDNPGIIRRIHDEIREIQPGLFLGPAMWKSREKVTFVLWFALDTHIQAKPLRWGDHG
ncbi:MAG TPA: hypothetical protein ENK31_01525 [Nannocystis exedens]|nr:hypothetical protein [Nannocystis exedens]